MTICFLDFPDGETVTVRLSGPGGEVRTHRTTESNLPLIFRLGMPLGRWAVRVSGPGVEPATATIRVTRPTTPTVHQVSDRGPSATAGTVLELAGFPGGKPVNIFLYGPRADARASLRFVRALPVAAADKHGEARYSVALRPKDLPGLYGIWLKAPCAVRDDGGSACVEFTK
ncbi:hypothetical protein [Paractinoplanes maris]|uniref:hypothetical protein n=1 Tax=Paractinoplanes maris TaxID=1734446 RepID=UPI0020200C93|nr:hypothetical protein [Actinoplanes maris]